MSTTHSNDSNRLGLGALHSAILRILGYYQQPLHEKTTQSDNSASSIATQNVENEMFRVLQFTLFLFCFDCPHITENEQATVSNCTFPVPIDTATHVLALDIPDNHTQGFHHTSFSSIALLCY